jgi:light-regulated signal transduction histidine kinase (bacteriophytochrome)
MPREIDLLSARIAELEDEKAALEAFAAVAAHEMMEPLVMTEGFVALVSERLDQEHADSREDLAVVARGVARARLLVETILHDARTAERDCAYEDVDLAKTVAESLESLSLEIEERDATVTIGDLPVVRGDRVLLGCVVSNLLVNALKYSPRRHCAIRVEARRDADEWRISVLSGGPTLGPEERERIFAEFNRARGERRARGTGLGLSICKRIVERHGGAMSVASANGSGNRFSFTLPAAR